MRSKFEVRRCEIEKYSSVSTWPVKMFARSQKYRIFGYSNIEFINKSAKESQQFFAVQRAAISCPNCSLGNQINIKLCGIVREDLQCFGWTNSVCWSLICERYHCVSCSDFSACGGPTYFHVLLMNSIFVCSLLSRFTNKLGIRRTFQMPVKMFARGRKNIFQFRFA